MIYVIEGPGAVSGLAGGIIHFSWPGRSPRNRKVLLVRRRLGTTMARCCHDDKILVKSGLLT